MTFALATPKMRFLFKLVRRAGLTMVCTPLFCGAAMAQGPLPPLFPNDAEASDVDEVEEVVADSEVLLPDESTNDGTAAQKKSSGKPRLDNIESAQAEELSYSQEEVRSRFRYLMGLALGTSMPWQAYSLSLSKLVSPKWAAGLYVGAGTFKDSGTIDEHAFDIKTTSRSAGVEGRYFFTTLERLSVQATLAYANWSGSVTLNSTEEDGSSAAQNLGSGFDASGVIFGVSSIVTWLWDSGFYVDWMPVGLRKSWIQQKELTRDSPYTDRLLLQKIERPYFYGITNVRFGYLF